MVIAVRPSTSADPVDLLEAAMGGMLKRDPARVNSYSKTMSIIVWSGSNILGHTFQYCATTCFPYRIYFLFPNSLQNAGYTFSRRKLRTSANRTWRRRLEYMRGSCTGSDKDRYVEVDVRSSDLVRLGVDG
ncbi:hypothetical protein M422DRAFT_26505, partial [Sphaerobolus stellatus SS14]